MHSLRTERDRPCGTSVSKYLLLRNGDNRTSHRHYGAMPIQVEKRPGVQPGRFLVTMLVPKNIAQEARRFSSSVLC